MKAERLWRARAGSPQVFCPRHRLQVIRANARAVKAQMIELQTIRNRPNEEAISKPMGENLPLTIKEHSIIAVDTRALPFPATLIGSRERSEKPLVNRYHPLGPKSPFGRTMPLNAPVMKVAITKTRNRASATFNATFANTILTRPFAVMQTAKATGLMRSLATFDRAEFGLKSWCSKAACPPQTVAVHLTQPASLISGFAETAFNGAYGANLKLHREAVLSGVMRQAVNAALPPSILHDCGREPDEPRRRFDPDAERGRPDPVRRQA